MKQVTRETEVNQAHLVHEEALDNLDLQVLSAYLDSLYCLVTLVPLESLDHVEASEHKDLLVYRETLDLLVQLVSKELLVQLVQKEPLVSKASLDNQEYQVDSMDIVLRKLDHRCVLKYP